MVAWLSDGQCQEENKQGTKISLLRDLCELLPPMLWKHSSASPHWIWWFRMRLGQLRFDSGVWSYLHPNRGHSSILMRFQQSDPLVNMVVDVMRPTYKFEPQYRVTMLTREEWTKATGAPPAVKGLLWFTDGSKMREGTGDGVYGQSVGRRLSFSLGR